MGEISHAPLVLGTSQPRSAKMAKNDEIVPWKTLIKMLQTVWG